MKTATLIDTTHLDYIEYIKEKRREINKNRIISRETFNELKERAYKRGIKKGIKLGEKGFRNTEKFAALIKRAYQKGLKDGKPKTFKLDRAAKKEAKAKALMEEAEKLKKSA